MTYKRIPIVIGVTGHRDLKEESIPELKSVAKRELEKLKASYPNSCFVMLNSIASGADTLCAEIALNLGFELICPLPMEVDIYKNDFEGEDLIKYERLLNEAANVFVVPHSEPFKEGKDYLYRQAGIYVANNCHVLLALWDGNPAKGNGCGTAEAVSFMLNGLSDHSFKSNDDGAVIHITTPRIKNNEELNITSKLIENKEGSLKRILDKTESFNKDSKRIKVSKAYSLLGDEKVDDKRIEILENIYHIADRLSLNKQKSYLRILRVIALISVGLVLCYLLYDEAEFNSCLICFGILLIVYAVFFSIVNKINKHESYLEYRVLAESFRVQYYLILSGIDEHVYDYYTWTQKVELTWIKKAIKALLIGDPIKEETTGEIVKKYWIDNQLHYHESAIIKDGHRHNSMKKATKSMLSLTCVMFIAVVVLEYFFNPLMDIVCFDLSLRTLFKIAWGCVSAVTVFISTYYGKMSLDRKVEDHDKMIYLFKEASKRYDQYPNGRKEIFKSLAKEEIIENGNWVSYCKENKPDFTL